MDPWAHKEASNVTTTKLLIKPLHMTCDADINGDASMPPTPVPIADPLTHARARQHNHQVSSFLSSCPSCLDPGNTCTFVLIRNQGEDRKGQGLTLAGFGLQQSTNL